MKKIIFTIIFALFVGNLFAQKDTTFYRHEVKVSVGDAYIFPSILWTNHDYWHHDSKSDADLYVNLSFSYFYHPLKWLCVGGNFINYFGEKIYYTWKEYDFDGSVKEFSKSKTKYCAVIAPEIRFSYRSKKNVILYSSLSGGVGVENCYYEYPEINYYVHLTFFGFSCNFGKNKNIFAGGELGLGFKGLLNIHGGYRF